MIKIAVDAMGGDLAPVEMDPGAFGRSGNCSKCRTFKIYLQ